MMASPPPQQCFFVMGMVPGQNHFQNSVSSLYSQLHPSKPPAHFCPHCYRAFTRRGNLMRHLRSHFGIKQFRCNECIKRFSTKSNLQSHEKTHERQDEFHCEFCGRHFKRLAFFDRHVETHEKQ
eukprot:TRINITY_DN3623_c0_g1_i1.p1 TRINITY_DN3623_c0_g1~~TRINITY_DN3623_c0_g1_i1.p1  ORF type:complete len:124 (-),score=12.21 TRINITY_DN3623_c0_g1_i1:67-438(-)